MNLSQLNHFTKMPFLLYLPSYPTSFLRLFLGVFPITEDGRHVQIFTEQLIRKSFCIQKLTENFINLRE